MDFQQVLVAWALGEIPVENLPAISDDALHEWLDSPSLRRLARLERPIPSKARPLFEAAIAELGFTLLREDEALMARAMEIAAEIVDETLDPFEGACRIRSLYQRHGGPGVLQRFGRLIEEGSKEIGEMADNITTREIERQRNRRVEIDDRYARKIVAEARRLLAMPAIGKY
jgi:hypothetical protein